MVVIDTESSSFELIESKKIIKSNKWLFNKCLKSDKKAHDVLHVISVISNVHEFKRRWQLMREFMDRMKDYDHIQFYVVELVYGDQQFVITDPTNPHHLQLRTPHALWHKENMINVGVKKLLPPDWKALAWIDSDIEFDSPNWALDTLKLLTDFDLVQLFTSAYDLNENHMSMNVWQSYGYKFCNGETFKHTKGLNYWHSGYAWACSRAFYDSVGGLYEKGIVGSGDYVMTQGFVGNTACGDRSLIGFKNDIEKYNANLCVDVKIGYIPCNIRHYFHGSKINRKYIERNQILIRHKYDPAKHLSYDENGILIPSEKMSAQFIREIRDYFGERNEDEYYELIKNIVDL